MLVCNTLIHRFKSGLRLLSEEGEILKNSVSLFFMCLNFMCLNTKTDLNAAILL